MTIKEEIQTIIDQRNVLDDRELENQLNCLVWEVKRICMNKVRELMEADLEPEDRSPYIDNFLIELDEAVK